MIVERNIKIGNRISGLAMVVFGGILTSGDTALLYAGGAMFMAEGFSDLISGQHHYLSTSILRYFSRDKLNIDHGGDLKHERHVYGKIK